MIKSKRIQNPRLWVLSLALPALMLFAVQPAAADSTFVSGEVFGAWELANSPFIVTGNLLVPSGYQLVIAAGVEVVILDDFLFEVRGSLKAEGSPLGVERINIRGHNTVWQGIRFHNPDIASRIVNCNLNDARVGIDLINCNPGSPLIQGNRIIASVQAINCDASSPQILNNQALTVLGVDNNEARYAAISLYEGSAPVIRGNNITCEVEAYSEAYGIYIRGYSQPVIEKNWIELEAQREGWGINATQVNSLKVSYNVVHVRAFVQPKGIYLEDATGVEIVNNNIVVEQSAMYPPVVIDLSNDSRAEITNNILIGNWSGIGVLAQSGRISESSGYNCFWMLESDWLGEWNPANAETNLSANPKFVDFQRQDYQLMENSPCIDAGSPFLHDEDGTRSDIGRYHYLQDGPIESVELDPILDEFELLSVHPNPFNYTALFDVNIRLAGSYRLSVWTLDGRLVANIWDGALNTGRSSYRLNGAGIPAGTYLVKLEGTGSRAARLLVYQP